MSLIGSPAAKTKLRDFIDTKHMEVAEEFLRIVNPLEVYCVQRAVTEPKVELSKGIRKRISDLTPLSRRPAMTH